MPLKPIDYSNTVFYRIVCNDLNIKDCYIGHTTNFIKRKQLHKSDCNNESRKSYNLRVYQFIRENGGWDNWSMIMIEQISCENFNEACKIERKFLEDFKATLNIVIPTRTQKEWTENNKDKIKEYREVNKEKIIERNKDWKKNNIDKIIEQTKIYREKNKDKIKEYREKNKDKMKEYREKNKRIILQKIFDFFEELKKND